MSQQLEWKFLAVTSSWRSVEMYDSPSQNPALSLDERLKILYPMVNEEETPLPRCWSTKVPKDLTGGTGPCVNCMRTALLKALGWTVDALCVI